MFGSIIGKNVFYKTIAHKNTTSLKNNHNCLTAHMCKLVKSLNSKLGNQPVKISEIIITISMITLIKVIKETEYVLQDSSQSSQSAVGEKKKHPFIRPFKKKKIGSEKPKTMYVPFIISLRYEPFFFNTSQNAQTWFFALKLLF